MADIEVLAEAFEPSRRGRHPLVDISPLLQVAKDNPGRWVAKEYSHRQATSVIRQMKTLGVEVASKRGDDEDRRVVFVKAGK